MSPKEILVAAYRWSSSLKRMYCMIQVRWTSQRGLYFFEGWFLWARLVISVVLVCSMLSQRASIDFYYKVNLLWCWAHRRLAMFLKLEDWQYSQRGARPQFGYPHKSKLRVTSVHLTRLACTPSVQLLHLCPRSWALVTSASSPHGATGSEPKRDQYGKASGNDLNSQVNQMRLPF